MAGNDGKDIEDFIAKIDEVSSVIKGLTSEDSDLQEKAVKEADKIIATEQKQKSTSSGFEKTQINKYENADGPAKAQKNSPLQFKGDSVSPEEFMKHVELDAAERRERKQQDSEHANELKEKGNNSFKRKDFNEAIGYYDEAIKIIRDNTVLYTNRAQALIHVGKNKEAIDDCLIAQKIDSKCLKAIIHQGRALQNLQRFDEAIKSFQRVKSIDKKHTKLAEGYIQEAQRLQELHVKEKQTILLESSGDFTTKKIKEIIYKLRKEDISYANLTEVLKNLEDCIDKDVYKTLFRTSGGFKMLAENPAINRLLKKENSHNDEESKSIIQILNLLSKVSLESEENTRELLHPSIFNYIAKFISATFALDIRIAAAYLAQIISQLEDGRRFLLQNGENESILNELLSLMTSNDNAAMIAAGVITNLALFNGLSENASNNICTKFLTFMKTMMEVFSRMEKENHPTESVLLLVSQSVTTVTNLARTLSIRTMLAKDKELWTISTRMIASYENRLENEAIRELIFAILGLLMNLSLIDKCTDYETCKEINDVCCHLLSCNSPNITERSAGLLNHLLTSHSELVQYNIEEKKYLKFFCVMKGQNDSAKNFIIKCIALCSSHETTMAEDLIQNKVVKSLLKLLSSNVDTAVGNAALVVGNCAKDKSFSGKLTQTNVVQDLLRISTNDDYKHTVKQNAAIAIGKLATTDPRHLERLRELHGLEILHQVLKAAQI